MGYTPLHYAAYNGDTATAASLLAEDRELVHATDQVREREPSLNTMAWVLS